MALSYSMTKQFTDVLRIATAIQVAVHELAAESCSDVSIALPALETCVSELVKAVKTLKKEL